MNTKTAEEKPDFRKLYPGEPLNDNAHRRVEGYIWGCEKIWDDYVTPLKKRIEELEAGLKWVRDGLDVDMFPNTINQLNEVLNPSTNGKQD